MMKTEADSSNGQTTMRPSRRVLLLDGGINPPELAGTLGRSLLDLPADEGRSFMDRWVRDDAGRASADVICLHAGDRPPTIAEAMPIRTFRDTSTYRGPAGVVRDARDAFGLEGVWVIGESTRLISGGIDELLAFHASAGADVTVGVNPDGTLTGMVAIDMKWADLVPARGFLDVKEQWLAKIVSRGGAVLPMHLASVSHQVRTRGQYLGALDSAGAFREHRELRSITSVRGRPTELAESGALIASGAQVASDAVVCRSVVCPGAVIEPGAVVVRSVVGHGSRVPSGTVVIERVVPARAAWDGEVGACRD